MKEAYLNKALAYVGKKEGALSAKDVAYLVGLANKADSNQEASMIMDLADDRG